MINSDGTLVQALEANHFIPLHFTRRRKDDTVELTKQRRIVVQSIGQALSVLPYLSSGRVQEAVYNVGRRMNIDTDTGPFHSVTDDMYTNRRNRAKRYIPLENCADMNETKRFLEEANVKFAREPAAIKEALKIPERLVKDLGINFLHHSWFFYRDETALYQALKKDYASKYGRYGGYKDIRNQKE